MDTVACLGVKRQDVEVELTARLVGFLIPFIAAHLFFFFYPSSSKTERDKIEMSLLVQENASAQILPGENASTPLMQYLSHFKHTL